MHKCWAVRREAFRKCRTDRKVHKQTNISDRKERHTNMLYILHFNGIGQAPMLFVEVFRGEAQLSFPTTKAHKHVISVDKKANEQSEIEMKIIDCANKRAKFNTPKKKR